MRAFGRAAVVGVVSLLVGLVVSWVAAVGLRSAVPGSGLLWRVASPAKVASWVLTGAHGVPVRIEAGAEVESERLRRFGERLGDLIGSQGGAEDGGLPSPSAGASVRLASFTVLGLAGAALAWGTKGSGVAGIRDAVVSSVVAGGVYGLGLAFVAGISGARLGFETRIVSAGIEASASPVAAFISGVVLGGLFAFLGAVAAPRVADTLSASTRAIGAGLRRGGAVAAGAASMACLVLAVSGAGGDSSGIDAGLAVLGAAMLGPNVVVAATVLAHGPPMTLAFDAGPLVGWTRIGYLTDGAPALPPTRWLFLIVPLLAGLCAGRAMRRRTNQRLSAAVGFGVAWGVLLALLAVMLRVDVLSSFSLGSLSAGGGARINAFLAFVAGASWAVATSWVGMLGATAAAPAPPVTGRPSPAPPAPPTRALCPACGASLPSGDRFCAACGAAVEG